MSNKIAKTQTSAPSTNSLPVVWRDFMPANYWSLEGLEEYREGKGQWPILRVVWSGVEEVVNPIEKKKENKIVVRFDGDHPAMVMGVGRCRLATAITGSADPSQWGDRLGTIELFPAIVKGKAQLSFRQVRENEIDAEVVSKNDHWD